MHLSTKWEINRITLQQQGLYDLNNGTNVKHTPPTNETTDWEIEKKLTEIDDVTNIQKQRLR